LLLDAEALRDSALRALPDNAGHVIIDPVALSQSISLRGQILANQVKLYKEAMSTDHLQQVLKAIDSALVKRDPEFARIVAADMRAIIGEYLSDA
jgi:hypothetical protein